MLSKMALPSEYTEIIEIKQSTKLLSVFNLTGKTQDVMFLQQIKQIPIYNLPKDRTDFCLCNYNLMTTDEAHFRREFEIEESASSDEEEDYYKCELLFLSLNKQTKVIILENGLLQVKCCLVWNSDFPSLYLRMLTLNENKLENFLQLPESIRADIMVIKKTYCIAFQASITLRFIDENGWNIEEEYSSCTCNFQSVRNYGLSPNKTLTPEESKYYYEQRFIAKSDDK